MFKKITGAIVIFCIVTLLMCSCYMQNTTETEIQKVSAQVTNVDYSKPWTQSIWSGKTMVVINHPEQFRVTITYEELTLTCNNRSLYEFYKDKVGNVIECELVTEYTSNKAPYRYLRLIEEKNLDND